MEISKKLARLSFSKKLKLIDLVNEKYPERYTDSEPLISDILSEKEIMELLREIDDKEKAGFDTSGDTGGF